MMDEFRIFLETSTIHGLSYISLAKKYARLFWTFIVISGFIGAVYLIQESFQFWSQNPIKTTIETLPISEVTFPKVSICPPKGTYTDLNYDLMRIGNRSIDYDLADENTEAYKLLEEYVRFFQNEDFKKKYTLIKSFNEENKYLNWYHGRTQANIKSYGEMVEKHNTNNGDFGEVERSQIMTSVATGNISTPHFGDKFQLQNFGVKKHFSIILSNPNKLENYQQTKVGTLILQFEYDVLEDFECLWVGGHGNTGKCFDQHEKYKEVRIENFDSTSINLERSLELNVIKLKELRPGKITGFKVTWKYIDIPQDSVLDHNYKGDLGNKNFIKLTNFVITLNQDPFEIKTFWNAVKQTKAVWKDKIKSPESFNYCYSKWCSYLPEEIYSNLITEAVLSINSSAEIHKTLIVNSNINNLDLSTAASIFVYIMTEQDEYWYFDYDKYSARLEHDSLRRNIGRKFSLDQPFTLPLPLPSSKTIRRWLAQ